MPEWAYGIALVIGAGAALSGLLTGVYADLFDGEPFDSQFVGGLVTAAVNLVVIAASVLGIARWQRDRQKVGGGFVVALFHETAGAADRGQDVQLMVLDALQEHVPETQQGRVHGIKATVDLGQREFAARLLRQLNAAAVLHGRVVDRADGGWTVHARLAMHSNEKLTHFDWHTNDTTPGRMPWAALFSKLPSTHGVTDEEFPLELTDDLAALMKGSVAAVGLADTPGQTEMLLKEALAVKPDSATPAMDVLRTQLAFAIFFQEDREDEALDLLRERIKAGDAFGELLRGFAFLADIRRGQLQRDLHLYGGEDPEARGDHELDDEDDEELDDEEFERDLSEEQLDKYRRAQALERESDALYEEVYQEEDDPEEGFETYDGHVKRLREKDASLRDDIIAALQVAVDDERDPRRDMSLYNLVNAFLAAANDADRREKGRGAELREEAWKRLDELHERSRYYRRTWYVKRSTG